MTPNQLKFGVDVLVLLLGLYSMYKLRQAAVGGVFGKAFSLILLGLFVLAINHFLDTVYLAGALKAAGNTTNFLQSTAVHRYINLIGFILMTLGFASLSKSSQG